MADGDYTLARVTVDITVRSDLAKLLSTYLKAGFFFQFPGCGMGNSLVLFHVQETAGKCPLPYVCRCASLFFFATLDEQDLQLLPIIAENHTVGRHSRVRIFVNVLTFFSHSSAFELRKYIKKETEKQASAS